MVVLLVFLLSLLLVVMVMGVVALLDVFLSLRVVATRPLSESSVKQTHTKREDSREE